MMNNRVHPYCQKYKRIDKNQIGFKKNHRTSDHLLTVSLSPLKGHKYCHNFINTLSGICHCNLGIEGTSHFLLSCPFYTVQRVTLVNSIKAILLKGNLIHLEDHSKLYLYGDPSISNADNKIILLSTIKYIKETQRFST